MQSILQSDDHLAAVAGPAARALADVLGRAKRQKEIRLDAEGDARISVAVPRQVLDLVVYMLQELAQGNGVAVIPHRAELTTQEAADLLNVSRPYLVQLLDEGKIPYRKVGVRRRVLLADVLGFKRKDDAQRAQIADALTAEAEALGLDD